MKNTNRVKLIIFYFIPIFIICSIIFVSKNLKSEKIWEKNEILLRSKIENDLSYEYVIDLKTYTPFEWDVVHFFEPYATEDKIYDTIGYKWENKMGTYKWDKKYDDVVSDTSKIIFMNEGKVVCCFYGEDSYIFNLPLQETSPYFTLYATEKTDFLYERIGQLRNFKLVDKEEYEYQKGHNEYSTRIEIETLKDLLEKKVKLSELIKNYRYLYSKENGYSFPIGNNEPLILNWFSLTIVPKSLNDIDSDYYMHINLGNSWIPFDKDAIKKLEDSISKDWWYSFNTIQNLDKTRTSIVENYGNISKGEEYSTVSVYDEKNMLYLNKIELIGSVSNAKWSDDFKYLAFELFNKDLSEVYVYSEQIGFLKVLPPKDKINENALRDFRPEPTMKMKKWIDNEKILLDYSYYDVNSIEPDEGEKFHLRLDYDMLSNTVQESTQERYFNNENGEIYVLLQSENEKNINRSGHFYATKDEIVRIKILEGLESSNVKLLLTGPNGDKQTFNVLTALERVKLSEGLWSFECFGEYESGDFTLIIETENKKQKNVKTPEFFLEDQNIISIERFEAGEVCKLRVGVFEFAEFSKREYEDGIKKGQMNVSQNCFIKLNKDLNRYDFYEQSESGTLIYWANIPEDGQKSKIKRVKDNSNAYIIREFIDLELANDLPVKIISNEKNSEVISTKLITYLEENFDPDQDVKRIELFVEMSDGLIFGFFEAYNVE